MQLTGNRTFILAVGALLGGFILALIGKLTPEFSTIAAVAVTAYSGKSAYTTGHGGAANTPAAEPNE